MANATANLHQELVAIATQEKIPAAAWMIKHPGAEPVIGTFGAKIEATTPFRFGSITKTFTAIALMKAAQEKGVAITTPLERVIPSRDFVNPFSDPVRLIDLAGLTAGHTDIGFEAFNDNTPHSLTEALRRNRDALTSRWPPGLLHSYSNATPGLSERAIEVLTGDPYPEALRKLLFEPLQLKQASFVDSAALPGGFRADGVTPIPYWNTTFKAFGGLNLSMHDMTTFVTTVLNQGQLKGRRIWTDDIHHQLITPAPSMSTTAGLTIGYGAGVYSRLRHGRLWHGHGGDADGYRARYAFLPQDDAAYVVVINTDNPLALIRMERLIEKTIAMSLPDRSVDPLVTSPTDPDFDGVYYPATVRFGAEAWQKCESSRLGLRAEKDKLFVRNGERRQALLSIDGRRFARQGENLPIMALVRDRDGVDWFVGELGNFVRIARRGPGSPIVLPPFLPKCLTE